MPVCGRFRKSPQAGPCKTAQRSGCRPHAPYRKPGRRRRRAAFPPAFPYFPADVGHRRADYEAPGFRLPQRDGAFQGSRHFPFSGQGNGTAPGFRERKFSVLPNGFLCESRSRTAPPPRSSFRLIRCLPEAQFPSVLGPAEGEGSGRSSVADGSAHDVPKPSDCLSTLRLAAGRLRPASIRRATGRPPPPFRSCDRRRLLRFPPLSAGAVFPGFFLLPPDGSAHDVPKPSDCPSTLRLAAGRLRPASIRRATSRPPPPRCGLQRAGSVPPRSAERRAVRRPRSGRATADGSPPVHGFRPSCGTDSAAPGGRLLGRRGIRRPPPVSRRVSVILPFRINKRPPPLDKRLRRSYLCRVSVSRAPPASGNQVYLGRPPSTASRAIREIELIPPARTRTSCGRAPQRSVRRVRRMNVSALHGEPRVLGVAA